MKTSTRIIPSYRGSEIIGYTVICYIRGRSYAIRCAAGSPPTDRDILKISRIDYQPYDESTGCFV
jgi:hypothetical protein